MNLWAMWLMIVILLTVIELSTEKVYTFSFILSSICSLILSFFVNNLTVQFCVFVVLGIILIIVYKMFLDKKDEEDMKHLEEDKLLIEEVEKKALEEEKVINKSSSKAKSTKKKTTKKKTTKKKEEKKLEE